MRKAIAPVVTLLVIGVGCATSPSGKLDANKNLVREFAEATNAADWDGLAEIVADDFSRHSAATTDPPVSSRDEFIQLQKVFSVAFPTSMSDSSSWLRKATSSQPWRPIPVRKRDPWAAFRLPVERCKRRFWRCSELSRVA